MAKRLVPIILKLGGSVVTIKEKPFRPNVRVIRRLVREISESNSMPLVVVHGGGSYGHPVAREYKIKDGYTNRGQLIGFSKTRQAMMTLNKLITDTFIEGSLSAVSLQPSALILTNNGRIAEFDCTITEQIISLEMIPILYGDAVLDASLGFTILSGDQIVSSLALNLDAERVVICVDVDGLYREDPKLNPDAEFINKIRLDELQGLLQSIEGSKTVDVTGGMYGKIIELIPALKRGVKVKIINAKKVNRLYKALKGEEVKGTEIKLR